MQIFVRNSIRNATFNQHIEQKCTQYNYYATFICSQPQDHHGTIFRERLNHDSGTSFLNRQTPPFSFPEGFLIYIVGCRGMGERGEIIRAPTFWPAPLIYKPLFADEGPASPAVRLPR